MSNAGLGQTTMGVVGGALLLLFLSGCGWQEKEEMEPNFYHDCAYGECYDSLEDDWDNDLYDDSDERDDDGRLRLTLSFPDQWQQERDEADLRDKRVIDARETYAESGLLSTECRGHELVRMPQQLVIELQHERSAVPVSRLVLNEHCLAGSQRVYVATGELADYPEMRVVARLIDRDGQIVFGGQREFEPQAGGKLRLGMREASTVVSDPFLVDEEEGDLDEPFGEDPSDSDTSDEDASDQEDSVEEDSDGEDDAADEDAADDDAAEDDVSDDELADSEDD